MRRNKTRTASGAASVGWDVVVTPATKQTSEQYYDRAYKSYDPSYIEGKVAVRLTLNGEPRMTYGVLSVGDKDFEDQITSLKAEAAEKASALNAVGAA